MNPIQKALDEVKFEIPEEILKLVFIDRVRQWRFTPVSIDEQIINMVIKPRVAVDCNLLGGTEVTLPLDNVPNERVDDTYTTIYRIPKSMTQGRSILSVKNITFSDPTFMSSAATIANMGASQMMYAAQAVMNVHATIPTVSSAVVQLIAENVVMVRDNAMLPANSYLRCVLANDENLSHLQMRSYIAFADMVVLAVKAFIYNNRIIPMDKGELFGGTELGVIKQIIEGYADSNELYRAYRKEKWQKIALMNDNTAHTRYLRRVIGGNR